MRLDRRISATLLAELQPGGALSSLVTLVGEEPELLDVGLGRSRSGKRSWAGLTAGAADVLAVDERAGLFRLRPDPDLWRSRAMPLEWAGWMTRRRLEVVWPDVRRATGKVLASPRAADALTDPRGRAMVRLGAPASGPLRVITRAPAISWDQAVHRRDSMARAARPLQRALAHGPTDRRWWPPHKRLVERLDLADRRPDLLAADASGRLLVVEVVGGHDPRTAAAAPVTASFAAALVAELVADATALDVLAAMLAQRTGLALARPGGDLASPARVVPVVALVDGDGDGDRDRDSDGHRHAGRDKALARLHAVAEAIAAEPGTRGALDPPEVWLLEGDGSLGDVLHPAGTTSTTASGSGPFVLRARAAAVAWKRSTRCLPEEARAPGAYQGRGPALPFCLPERFAPLNLLPEAREVALERFEAAGVGWHHGVDGGPSNHLLSSQVQCANALAPLVGDPEAVCALFATVVPAVRVLPFGGPRHPGGTRGYDAEDHVVFAWSGPSRPAGATRADAAFRYLTPSGDVELALIDWRYAERARPDRPDAASLEARAARYRAQVDDPDGPLRRDLVPLEDLVVEPFERLLRVQLLAWRMERAQELGAQRARVVLVAPAANTELWTSLPQRSHRSLGGGYGAAWSSPAQSVLDVWRALQRRPDRFAYLDTATVVGPAAPTSPDFRHRYGHVAGASGGGAGWWLGGAVEERMAAEARLFAAAGLARGVLGNVGGSEGVIARIEAAAASAVGDVPLATLAELAARLEELAELGRRLPVEALPGLASLPSEAREG